MDSKLDIPKKQYKVNLNNIKKIQSTANTSSYSKNIADEEEWKSF